MSPHPKVIAIFLLFSVQCHATSIAVAIIRNNIVIAADSKQAWADPRHSRAEIKHADKLIVLNDRTVVALGGLAKNGSWDEALFIERVKNSLPANARVSLVETVIVDKLKPLMGGFSSYLMNDPIGNKKAFPVVLIEFTVAGYENGVPVVDSVYIGCDWKAGKTTGPTVNPVYTSQNSPTDFQIYLIPFGQAEAIHTALADPSSSYRKTLIGFAGLARVVAPPTTVITRTDAINAATDVVRFEAKFQPELVGSPINLVVLSRKDDPVVKSLPE